MKVAYWAAAPTAEQQEILQREFIDSFNSAHAGEIELEMSFLEKNVEVTQTALAAGAGPDIYDVHGPAWVSQFTSAGFTLPLDDFAEQYAWNEKLLDWALEVGMVAGSLRSLPQTYEDPDHRLQQDAVRGKGLDHAHQPRRVRNLG
ncbi:MAG: extracellular solute-binding protein [Anaerolineae bacterium]|nr:extracellular solute-binding protein [Anaerolineae bacterium]